MTYEALAVYSLQGAFVGYVIKGDSAIKLQSTNLYNEQEKDELTKRLESLNESELIKGSWPDAHDPEVQALVDDPNFEPIEYTDAEVIDESNSYLVYEKVPNPSDILKLIDGPNLDHDASVLRYVTKRVPARPSDWYERTKKAQELVARRRL